MVSVFLVHDFHREKISLVMVLLFDEAAFELGALFGKFPLMHLKHGILGRELTV